MGNVKELIESGRAVMGLEFGSTRIKAVLIGEDYAPIASGGHVWKNKYKNGVWTYSLDDIHNGLQDCYRALKEDVKTQYGVKLKKLAAIGISGMMHGYLPFDKNGKLLVPFRTWRNTITGEAAAALTREFDFNIPQRWSIAHLYQAILNGEEHVKNISYFTTLAGYIHWKLTGEKVMGVGEASGMFPINDDTRDYDKKMMGKFDALIADKGFSWKLEDIIPKVLYAGDNAGKLTEEGAKFLDPSGDLMAGIPLCPPEGDAGTGMTATNSVAKRTGNVSAGTSFFAMVVLEKSLSKVHEELDMVTTPDGAPVAMAHCNNGTTDLNGWVHLFREYEEARGNRPDMAKLFSLLYNTALEGDKNCGGLLAYNYNAGEAITGLNAGRPMFIRTPDAKFTLANFMRSHLYASLATLKIGCDILFKEENVKVDKLYGHGGFFKTKGVGQSMLAAAMNAPVAVMETAGEGGPWGMALLAAYMLNGNGEDLGSYLSDKVFAGEDGEVMEPDPEDVKGFDEYIEAYKKTLPAEAAAAENFNIHTYIE
ncbi:MAG: FGGY-family carbohydrate kinase [Lachnospiraceae bacterium]|nr:FGGY-family carbohydrate kinase [Lachnospiraceae bacterium]